MNKYVVWPVKTVDALLSGNHRHLTEFLSFVLHSLNIDDDFFDFFF